MKSIKSMIKNSKKQGGFVMTSELILLSTVMAAGLVIGLTTMRDSVTAELEDVAEAIGSLDQSYAFDGIINAENTAEISGSGFIDAVDVNAGDGATFTFVASDFSEAAVSISNTPSAAGASPSVEDGSLDN
ncbi:hypothetical protein [Shewanella ulleungensis]|jgi:predicted hydrocarbon binding protein|uniref:Type II secretion system protein n=1 Tax=Shewanella ulleungensis TaxID=2282699 RepID=A0ABQ2QDK7_9GAMM|nr:hypothetical protein [Shewanella ulleungensis]MCL1148739.1 hypothetical protein [Shewanella ulleungensis]GGP75915.1 hypothetical protein GCM10009410_05240 [Shewanella ulleungensis]